MTAKKKTQPNKSRKATKRNPRVANPPAPPVGPPMEVLRPKPTQIEIVDCCGVFGYLIPWAQWKIYSLPLIPTRDFSRPYIYLYSVVGQLGILDRNVVPRSDDANLRLHGMMCGAINIDKFLDYDSKLVDWNAVARQIFSLHAK